jgi:hypothetical protein
MLVCLEVTSRGSEVVAEGLAPRGLGLGAQGLGLREYNLGLEGWGLGVRAWGCWGWLYSAKLLLTFLLCFCDNTRQESVNIQMGDGVPVDYLDEPGNY